MEHFALLLAVVSLWLAVCSLAALFFGAIVFRTDVMDRWGIGGIFIAFLGFGFAFCLHITARVLAI